MIIWICSYFLLFSILCISYSTHSNSLLKYCIFSDNTDVFNYHQQNNENMMIETQWHYHHDNVSLIDASGDWILRISLSYHLSVSSSIRRINECSRWPKLQKYDFTFKVIALDFFKNHKLEDTLRTFGVNGKRVLELRANEQDIKMCKGYRTHLSADGLNYKVELCPRKKKYRDEGNKRIIIALRRDAIWPSMSLVISWTAKCTRLRTNLLDKNAKKKKSERSASDQLLND